MANSFNKLLIITGVIMMFFGCSGKYAKKTNLTGFDVRNWICVYSADAAPAQIQKFDLAVLDAEAHPDLTGLKKSPTLLFGYLSLGEVGDYRWYWPEIANESYILAKNPNWNSRMIDIRQEAWQNFVINKIIPRILEQGFRGLFLDTIDNAEYLEKYHPEEKYPGSQKAMIRFIRKIRATYPDVFLLANRGFPLLNEIGKTIDGVVAESLFTDYDFEKNNARIRSENEYGEYLNLLKSAQEKNNLLVLSLDYTNTESGSDIQTIIQKSKENGFLPYISTIDLTRVYFNTFENRL